MTAAGYDDYYRVRIRNRADSADLLVLTSVPAGTNPYIKEPPHGDGASFNPMTNDQMVGSYTVLVTDAITSGTDRVITSQLEDVNGLLQLGFLKTFIEGSRDGATWGRTLLGGYLTVARLVDAATWELTIQGALRALDGVRLFNPQSTTLITDFLASWPVRGCVLGGPVMNSYAKGAGFPNLKDLGGWRMKVRAFGPDSFGTYRYQLAPVNVYGPPDFSPDHGHIKDYADVINQGVSQLPIQNENGTTGFTTVNEAQLGSMWQGLFLLIDGVPFAPIAPDYSPATGNIRTVDPANPFLFLASDFFAGNSLFAGQGLFARLHGQTPLTNDAIVKVRALTVLPSPISPVYLDRHPIDLLSDLCTLAGIGFVDTLGIKTLFGADLRETLRLANPAITMGQLLKSAVYDLGIAIRSDASARVVPVATRKFSNALPTRTIDDTLVHEGSVSLPFEQDVSVGGLQTVTFRQKVFGQAGDSFSGGVPTRTDLALGRVVVSNALDGITEREDTYTALNKDANPLLSGAEEVAIAGQLRHSLAGQIAVDRTFWDTLAQELFDRFGRSNEQGELDLKRGDGTTDADLSDLGDEVLLSIKQLPNRNKRIGDDGSVGARAVQIIRLTETPARRPVRWSSSGANAQPLTTKPTLSIAATSDLPRTTAQTTVTNAAALNGLGYAVRFQMALVAHGASAPASTAYVDYRITAPAAIPTGAVRMPAATAGYDVYVRARSEFAGHRPSDWSTVQHVSLSLVDDPTSVVAAAVSGDGSLVDLTWAIGANAGADVTDLYVRLSAEAFSAAVRVGTVLAGSNRFQISGLTPGTAYKVSVQHRDPSTGDLSDPVDASVTTDGSTMTLAAPTNAVGFSEATGAGRAAAVLTGLYGMGCQAIQFPANVEFQEAIETSVGSNLYGTFNVVARMPGISGDLTIFSRIAPNDGLRRRLRARHVLDGTTPSLYTAPVTVTPWTFDPIEVEEAAISLNDFKSTDSADGLTRNFAMIAGGKVETVYVFVCVQQLGDTTDPWPGANDAPVAGWGSGLAGKTGTRITPDPVTGAVTYALTLPTEDQQIFIQFEPRREDHSPGFVRRVPIFALPAPSISQGTVAIDTNGATSWQADGPAAQAYIKYAESTSAFPSDADAAAGTTITGRQVSRTGGPTLSFGQTLYVTAIPYTADDVPLRSFRMKGARQSYTATVTRSFSPVVFTQDPTINTNLVVGFNLGNLVAGIISNIDLAPTGGGPPHTFGAVSALLCHPVLPDGATITQVQMEVYNNDTTTGPPHGAVGFEFARVVGNAETGLATANTTTASGWQLVTASLSELTTGRAYTIYAVFSGADTSMGSGFSTPADVLAFGQTYITYTIPDPKTAA